LKQKRKKKTTVGFCENKKPLNNGPRRETPPPKKNPRVHKFSPPLAPFFRGVRVFFFFKKCPPPRNKNLRPEEASPKPRFVFFFFFPPSPPPPLGNNFFFFFFTISFFSNSTGLDYRRGLPVGGWGPKRPKPWVIPPPEHHIKTPGPNNFLNPHFQRAKEKKSARTSKTQTTQIIPKKRGPPNKPRDSPPRFFPCFSKGFSPPPLFSGAGEGLFFFFCFFLDSPKNPFQK